MGRLKSHLQDWLETYGYELGYDMSNAPELPDLWWIAEGSIEADDYWERKKKWKRCEN